MARITRRNVHDIYLEYVNDWISAISMAAHYEVNLKWLRDKIERGKKIHNSPNTKVTTEAMDLLTEAYYRAVRRLEIIAEVFELYLDMAPAHYNDKAFHNDEFDRLYDMPFLSLEEFHEKLMALVYPDHLHNIGIS